MSNRPSDPTRTITLRRYFVGQFNSRFAALRKLVTKSIVNNDCLNLSSTSFAVAEPYVPDTWKMQLKELHRDAFDFRTDSGKVSRFMEWLTNEENKALFQTVNLQNLGEGIEPIWTNVYIREFYQKGIKWSRDQMNAKGMRIPVDKDSIADAIEDFEHVDRLGAVYTRVFSDLKGVTATMDATISAVLADGLRAGNNPREIAKEITNKLDKIGRYRATLIARTESIRAHHLASMQEYKNAGVAGVEVKAEWSTANDARVCRRCAGLDYDRTGKVWKIEEIEPLIPLHPQCRCAALPHVILPGEG